MVDAKLPCRDARASEARRPGGDAVCPVSLAVQRTETPEGRETPNASRKGNISIRAVERGGPRHADGRRRSDAIAAANLQYADSIIIKKIGWIPEEGALNRK